MEKEEWTSRICKEEISQLVSKSVCFDYLQYWGCCCSAYYLMAESMMFVTAGSALVTKLFMSSSTAFMSYSLEAYLVMAASSMLLRPAVG
jgi:hypothetical protein